MSTPTWRTEEIERLCVEHGWDFIWTKCNRGGRDVPNVGVVVADDGAHLAQFRAEREVGGVFWACGNQRVGQLLMLQRLGW